jgi:2-methylcitrate dehydratase PrpD
MDAIGLLQGQLTAADYEDDIATDPSIYALRDKMHCIEKESYTADCLNPDKGSIANTLQVIFTDGTSTEDIAVEYPIGHRHRRKKVFLNSLKKFEINLARRFPVKQQQI